MASHIGFESSITGYGAVKPERGGPTQSFVEGRGVGGRLIDAVAAAARLAGATRLRTSTTNDNLHALGFLQRRGFRLTTLYAGAAVAYAMSHPELAAEGMDGIPRRDALELELDL